MVGHEERSRSNGRNRRNLAVRARSSEGQESTQFRLCRPGSARQVNPNKRTPELEQTYLAIRHPPAG